MAGEVEIKHIILKNEVENRVLLLADTDLWGIVNALHHTIQSGYAKDNLEWTENMIAAIDGMRDNGWMAPDHE